MAHEELTPRQMEFLRAYFDTKSPTFGNCTKSAMSCGYSEEYAKVLMNRDLEWMSKNVKLAEMLKKAERNLDELQDSDDERIKLDAAKFVASRLGKADWSEKTETDVTSGGKPIMTYGWATKDDTLPPA